MAENSLYERNEKEFTIVYWGVQIFSIVVLLMLLLCPLFSYNANGLIKQDTLGIFSFIKGLIEKDSVTVTFTNKSVIFAVVFLIFMTYSVNACTGRLFGYLKKDIWKEKMTTLIVWFVIGIIFWVVGFVLGFQVKEASVTISQTKIKLPLSRETWFYVLSFANLIPVIVGGIYLLRLYLVYSGKKTEGEMFPNALKPQAVNGNATTAATPAKSDAEINAEKAADELEGKLKGLARLKEIGVISEEEFVKKKEELLANYK